MKIMILAHYVERNGL
ncbi:UNVERIFIED_CONTAM: hypothetical protein GTU68_025195 [Idotea baltica]|nr:hypothetical protein [Idotea baltica]